MKTGKPNPALPGEVDEPKTCVKCRRERPLEEFSWRDKAHRLRQSDCKECMNARGRENYQRFAQRYKDVAKARNAEMRRRLNALKAHPCADCGGEFPPYAMDFDHVRGAKTADVSEMFRRRYAWEKILEEVEKCDLVCATCHRLRTLKRRQKGGPVDGDF